VAVECDRYGYRFEATPSDGGSLSRPVLQPDGRRTEVDIRKLPFVRFQDNEAHAQLYGLNLGEGVEGVGPDPAHPFWIRQMRIWDTFWAFRPGAPSIVVDGMDVYSSRYGIFTGSYDPRIHTYGRATFKGVHSPGVLTANPTALPGEKAPLPTSFDDWPPSTVITHVSTTSDGRRIVRGTTADDGPVRRVLVNGTEARRLAPDFLEWEADLAPQPGGPTATITAFAEDDAGHVEPRPHVVRLP
jgi:hypothetical protein